MEHMKTDGLIEGFEIHRYINGHVEADFTRAQITPAESATCSKQPDGKGEFLEDVNGIIPF